MIGCIVINLLGTVINHEVITDKAFRCGLDENIEDILINEVSVSILLVNMPIKCLYTKCVPKYRKDSWVLSPLQTFGRQCSLSTITMCFLYCSHCSSINYQEKLQTMWLLESLPWNHSHAFTLWLGIKHCWYSLRSYLWLSFSLAGIYVYLLWHMFHCHLF